MWEGMSEYQRASVTLVHLMLIGQSIFLVLWLVLPWWRSWVGRALMIKSFALWILLAFALVQFWTIEVTGDWPLNGQAAMIVHAIVVIGIWSQVVALSHEMRAARSERRRIVGTSLHPKEDARYE